MSGSHQPATTYSPDGAVARVRCSDLAVKRASARREGAARTAVYGLQVNDLQLLPWQNPPCCLSENEAADIIVDPNSHDKPGALALKKLRRRGKSIWEPDLRAALA